MGPGKRLARAVGCCIVLAGCLLGVQGCGAQSDSTIVIGYLGPLSGRSSGLGLGGRDGALLAVEQANASGGVGGRAVELIAEDDGAGATATVSGIRSLDKVGAIAVIGPLTSSSAEAAIPVANGIGLPLLSPTVSSTDFTGADDSFLRTCADNRKYANGLAAHVLELAPKPDIALVYDTGNRSYTERLAQHFSEAIVRGGGSVVATATFESGTHPDYEAIAKTLISKEPDGVFIAANSIDSGLLSQRVRGAGHTGLIALSHWAATGDLVGSGGRAVDGAVFMDNWDRASTDPSFRDFISDFQARFHYPANFAAVHSYDATKMLLRAAATASERTAVRRALLDGGPYAGIQGEISLDADGDCDRPFYPTTIASGVFVTDTGR